MEFAKACYSYESMYSCMDKVKELPAAPAKRSQHQAMCYGDLYKAFEFCFSRTDCLLFDPDFGPWRDYADGLKQGRTKKELDQLYRACIRFLSNQLSGILSLMESGEVNSKE